MEEPSFKDLLQLVAMNSGPLESAVELDRSSSLESAKFAAGADVLVKEGYGTFVEAFGQEVMPHVRLNAPVTKISYGASGVSVETATKERFKGRKVLVTVSTGVLASGKIAFEPALPADKREAIAGLPMGLLNKVILEFSTADVFPEDDGAALDNTWVLYGGDLGSREDDMAFVFRPMDTNTAIGFFGGDRAWELEKQPGRGKDAMTKLAVTAMSAMCKCDAGKALVKSRTTAWGSESWTHGAYSAALPGKSAMRGVLAKPVAHQVYFAGEACYNATYNGSFAAAYNSAIQASYTLLRCLKREDGGAPCK
ncbi:putative amine oxidase protein [Chondromyces apiculatus DSM 436]|uniref:Tryptophan 2-monooxygenase n=1 Tax=Chondromyces apiculatus DSM 436 TaxID=1192034 RepID=A0A017TE50_9BACT|nr:putative amine oxidase protein [Chondromyces apiculatus DSM 436]